MSDAHSDVIAVDRSTRDGGGIDAGAEGAASGDVHDSGASDGRDAESIDDDSPSADVQTADGSDRSDARDHGGDARDDAGDAPDDGADAVVRDVVDAAMSPSDAQIDRATEDGAAGCGTFTLQGSVVVRNAFDVGLLAGVGKITGDLVIDAAGLVNLSLPSLCSLGGNLTAANAPDLVTLDLPALGTLQNAQLGGAPHALMNLGALVVLAGDGSINVVTDREVNLKSLRTAANLNISSGTGVDLSALESVAALHVSYGASSLSLSKLSSAGSLSLDCIESCGPAVAPELEDVPLLSLERVSLSAPKLLGVTDLSLNDGNTDLDAPLTTLRGSLLLTSDTNPRVLSTLATIAVDATIRGPATAPLYAFGSLVSVGHNLIASTVATSMAFPLLQTVGNDFTVHSGGTSQSLAFASLRSVAARFDLEFAGSSVTFPMLTTIGGGESIVGRGSSQRFEFPSLTSLDAGPATSTLAYASIDVPGVFSAPNLVKANHSIVFRSVTDLDLSSLQSVGDFGTPGVTTCSAGFILKGSMITTLRLPALVSACLDFGIYDLLGCREEINPLLTAIIAPNLVQGNVVFWSNPAFPACRADALASQLTAPWRSEVHCPLAAGPCP